MTRTEDQIALQEPLSLTFGTQKYKVPILNIRKSRAWRLKYESEVAKLFNVLNVEGASGEQSISALGAVLLQYPEKLADLVFEYAPELPRDTITDEATEEQLASAFTKILNVAYPYLASLVQTQAVLAARQRQQESSIN